MYLLICPTFLTRNVKQLPDLGKSLPWPQPPRQLRSLAPKLQNIHQRWRAFKILSKYPRESWPEMNLKLSAMELLRGQRNQWGIDR